MRSLLHCAAAVFSLVALSARADSKGYAALGVDDFIGVHALGFTYSGQGLLAEPIDQPPSTPPSLSTYSGLFAGARFDVGGYLIQTHFGTPAGMEFHFAVGFVTQDGPGRFKESPGRAHLETDTEVNVAIIAHQFGPIRFRIMALAGFGANSDTPFAVVGGRIATTVVPNYVNLAFGYTFRPALVGGAQHRGEVAIKTKWGVTVGGEYWLGTTQHAVTGLGMANGVLKGDYSAIVFFAGYRWTDDD